PVVDRLEQRGSLLITPGCEHSLDEHPEESLKHRRFQITSPTYRMSANWNTDGRDGPAHIVVGFAPTVSLKVAKRP
ncbi:MAG: hypothetical protein ABEN55_08125, partial [Bradymonadaceae bacterium]